MKAIARLRAWDAASSLGESAVETALWLRAGVANVASSHFIDAAGQRVMTCTSPALPSTMPPVERMLALAVAAIDGTWRSASSWPADASLNGSPVILLALPERFAVSAMRFELTPQGRGFLQALRERLPAGLQHAVIEAFPFGRAAGALAMQRAPIHLRQGRVVLWGGVDSLHDWAVIEALIAADRLVTVDNTDGIRPGEAAAFALLAPHDDERDNGHHRPRDVLVRGLGLGREHHLVGADTPCRSDGLCTALDAAVAPLRLAGRRTNGWLLDTSHEAYATHEVQSLVARLGDVLGTATALQTPMKELGDVGSATLPLLAVLAAEAWRLGHAADDCAVISGCSEQGARGAMLLATPDARLGATT